MCFSAGASFGASAVLSVIGVTVLKKARTPSQIPFASIPFIFAVQQFSEGFVWLSLTHPSFAFMEKIATYTFLLFAQIIWPLFVPFSVMILEKKLKYKRILMVFAGIGILVASYYAHRLMMYGAHANISGHHIAYRQVYPDSWGHIADLFYGIASLTPTFITRTKRMWVFGLAVSISYLITYIFYVNYILSVWCFFSAIISILIYMIVNGINVRIEKSDVQLNLVEHRSK